MALILNILSQILANKVSLFAIFSSFFAFAYSFPKSDLDSSIGVALNVENEDRKSLTWKIFVGKRRNVSF